MTEKYIMEFIFKHEIASDVLKKIQHFMGQDAPKPPTLPRASHMDRELCPSSNYTLPFCTPPRPES